MSMKRTAAHEAAVSLGANRQCYNQITQRAQPLKSSADREATLGSSISKRPEAHVIIEHYD
ncbi:hypothetical protein [Bradyrhizobium australiense]|uniref:Uncharacterized protein n=1 Tax=Bradyrhizobium australiense TaxID=2721161 RepID=A0A7Y4GXU4_9BRAD|nr:hypothetical protein [Bradyrhizobium australiense]NOJ43871.1 hypothetical protein [Bradyrhizobium australiense]